MNTYELARKLKPFDKYKRKIDPVSEFRNYDPDKLFGFSLPDLAADDWEIKKKEAEPITAEEAYEEYYNLSFDKKIHYTDGFKDGDSNGILKTELKYKKLVSELNKLFERDRKALFQRLLNLIEN